MILHKRDVELVKGEPMTKNSFLYYLKFKERVKIYNE